MVNHDYTDFETADDGPRDSDVARLTALADEYQHEVVEMLRIQEQLKKATERIRVLAEVTIPAAMEEAKSEKIVTNTGLEIKVEKKLHGNINKANEEKAHAWLEANGHDRIIKQEFQILFGKDDEAWAKKFARDCARRKRPLHLKRKKGVHQGTLGAWIREMKGNGVPIPDDLFGVFEKKEAKIKAVKK